MYMFQAEASRYGAGMPHILAGFVVVAIPTSALWIMGQKLITSKMMVGGLKE
jgi:ABC-type maltose transport system permease subunit